MAIYDEFPTDTFKKYPFDIEEVCSFYEDIKVIRKLGKKQLDELHNEFIAVGASSDYSIQESFYMLKVNKPLVFLHWTEKFRLVNKAINN